MNPQTIIFVGRSGCGKGTQAKLFIDYLKSRDTSREIFYLETGDMFRKFIAQDSYSSKLSREIMSKGTLQPSFLAVHIWSHLLIEHMKGGEHLIIDGTPRTHSEAQVLDSAFSFYGREKPIVFLIDVSKDWAMERLMSRGRADDSKGDITKRLEWFDTDVVAAIRHMQAAKMYSVLSVNGEQSIEKVHSDIVAVFEKTA